MKIFYSILHYQNIDVTKDCVKYLLEQKITPSIVIVDNCSPNGSGEHLMEIYKDYSNIHVIINNENKGFAQGNNIGYNYAKKQNADFVVVMNNDVMIENPYFGTIISDFMMNNKIDVCGPDIVTPDKLHQNPHLDKTYSIDEIRRIISHNKLVIKILNTPLLNKLFIWYRKFNRIKLGKEKIAIPIKSNPVLHGAIIAFGPNYLKNESHAFLPITFMYGEECILHDYLMHKLYTTGVCLSCKVLHLGGKSTNISQVGKECLLFKYKNANKSWLLNIKQQELYKND